MSTYILCSFLILLPLPTFSFSLSQMLAENKTAACLIGGLAITSSILGYMVWKQNLLLRSAAENNQHLHAKPKLPKESVAQPEKQSEQCKIEQIAVEKVRLEEELQEAQNRIEQLHKDAAYTKECGEDTVACLKKEQFKVASIGFMIKAWDLKKSGISLIGLTDQFKKQKSFSASTLNSFKELLSTIERLIKDISDTDQNWDTSRVDTAGQKIFSRLLSLLNMKDPMEELSCITKNLHQSAVEIRAIIGAYEHKKSEPVVSRAIESGAGKNAARLFVNKNQELPPHQVLGIASDAMMPDIMKAYKALSLQFHSDKAKVADKTDYEEAMKMINEARLTMVQAFNS